MSKLTFLQAQRQILPNTLLTSTAYFPPLAWYIAAAQSGKWLIEDHENFQKGGYRNRCRIATANGPAWLSIPLEKGKNQGTPITSVKISYINDWPREHIQSIRTAYGRAPYFEYYAPALFDLIQNKTLLLRQFNTQIMELINSWLLPTVEPVYTSDFIPARELTDTLDLRSVRSELPLVPPEYPQLFTDRHGFNGELSILDLIFCQGPAAATYLRTN